MARSGVAQPELQSRAAAGGEPENHHAADPKLVEQQGEGVRLPSRGGTWRQRRAEVSEPRRSNHPEAGPGHPRPPAIHRIDMTPQYPMTDQKRDPLALVDVLDRAETCFEPSGRDRIDPVPRPAHVLPVPAHHFLLTGRTRPSLAP